MLLAEDAPPAAPAAAATLPGDDAALAWAPAGRRAAAVRGLAAGRVRVAYFIT